MADDPPFRSLAESLGLVPERQAPEPSLETVLVDVKNAKEFANAVIDSREFREYIVNGLKLGTIPGFATLLKTVLDRSDWGVVPNKTELTGKDGQPLETVTEVRRVVVRPEPSLADFEDRKDERPTTH